MAVCCCSMAGTAACQHCSQNPNATEVYTNKTYTTDSTEFIRTLMVNPQIKKTNADRIRAMTDEELDGFLNEVQGDAYLVGFHASAESRFTPYGKRWLKWLKQEVSTDG